jgi:hypothetical protein
MNAAVKSLLLVLFAGLVLAVGTAAPAAAATPCWKAVINDWFDGRIDKTYPAACYTQALKHLPRDADIYSSAPDDIRRAQLVALRKGDKNEPPTSAPSRSIESAGSPSDPPKTKNSRRGSF